MRTSVSGAEMGSSTSTAAAVISAQSTAVWPACGWTIWPSSMWAEWEKAPLDLPGLPYLREAFFLSRAAHHPFIVISS